MLFLFHLVLRNCFFYSASLSVSMRYEFFCAPSSILASVSLLPFCLQFETSSPSFPPIKLSPNCRFSTAGKTVSTIQSFNCNFKWQKNLARIFCNAHVHQRRENVESSCSSPRPKLEGHKLFLPLIIARFILSRAAALNTC
jgi:hypothetical protein